MANIKISELNELSKNQRAYNDYVPIVDTSTDETKKISLQNIMQNNIQLLAVSDIAPSECSTGDKYYNTTTKKIYTAIEEDTWGTVGEDPISDILYIVLEERTSYTYDGTDLVSVGGGSESEIIVEPDEPTEDTKLIFESIDLDAQYTEAEYYSTEETLTNKVWIDGKPIYRKVFTGTIGSSGSSVTVGNIPNINVIAFSGIVNTINSRQHPISTYWTDAIKNVPEYFKSNGNIVLNYSAQYYGQDYELIVEYTKN